MIKEAIIVGGGPSALTAALYLGRYGIQTSLITENFGGQTIVAGSIENFPGFLEIDGFDLIQKMKDQVEKQENVELISESKVKKITESKSGFKVLTDSGEYETKSVLIAAGKSPRKLGIENEEDLVGKGVSYCATCDGPLAKGRAVVVAGGGYAATEAALILSKLANSVTIINNSRSLNCDRKIISNIEERKNIKVVCSSKISAINKKDGVLTGVKYMGVSEKVAKDLNAKMLFVEIGQKPNSETFANFVDLNERGEIIIDPKSCETSRKGVFAAGDITDVLYKQIVIASGEGAKAAISINKYLEKTF
ncbi:MAG: FAD-dependent oxidoreductase [Candidatus Berkelbacteria bacterium]|nr:FAD-dependent oxidoreductase [Candidatus Berkelbacteria bacterium]